jgi:hypothetical protein
MSNLKVDGVEPNSTAAVTVGGTGNLTTDGSAGNLVVKGTATVGGTLTTNGTTDHNGAVDATGYTITATTINAISALQINGSAIDVGGQTKFLGVSSGTSTVLTGSSIGLRENGNTATSAYGESTIAWTDVGTIKISAQLQTTSNYTSQLAKFATWNGTTWTDWSFSTLGTNFVSVPRNSTEPLGGFIEIVIHNANFAANTDAPDSTAVATFSQFKHVGWPSTIGESGVMRKTANGQIKGFRFTGSSSNNVRGKIQAWGFKV